MPGFIDDGYTRQGYIKPLEPFHEGLRFEYRPVTISDRNRILSRVAACGGNKPEQIDKAVREASKAVVERVTSWDLKDSKGNVVTINEANVMRLESHLHGSLFDVITGTQPSDENPVDEGEAEKN